MDNVARGTEVRQSQKTERAEIAQQQQDLRDRADTKKTQLRQIANTEIANLQSNIDRYRAQAQETVNAANSEINTLRDSATSDSQDNFERVEELNAEIDSAYGTISDLNAEKFEAEREVRALEQEVGPIKYVAELVYGDQSQELLDKSVRLFILLLVFVFDPLAVMLVIAANQTLLRYGINLESTGPKSNKSMQADNDLEYEKNTATEHHDYNSTVVEVSGPERVVEVTKSEEVNIGTSEVLKELEKKLQQRLNKDG